MQKKQKNKLTINKIWQYIESDIDVYWSNNLYYIHKVKVNNINNSNKLSYKNGYALRITCKSNYFGSLITLNDLKDCYI